MQTFFIAVEIFKKGLLTVRNNRNLKLPPCVTAIKIQSPDLGTSKARNMLGFLCVVFRACFSWISRIKYTKALEKTGN